ncbi:MAG: hypothetical protein H6654_11570 [Ardenticatenaceae bacterium]|nr:hypothetical protein [Anaerolineales bacterium]MCB8937618.1 hypothetical protein [Ardenticatenaceae bacterium]MCB8974187.1 hypothetical protein [Ardenticatenaceae bacterium]
MQTNALSTHRHMPGYPVRFALGLLVLLLTLGLLVTAVAAANFWEDADCDFDENTTLADFSAETDVPACWLVQ